VKKILSIIVLILFFAGCADKGYTLDETERIYTTVPGVVVEVKGVTIEAGSSGSAVGGIVGFIIGTQVGKGKGNVAATLAGGLLGSLLGAKAALPGQQLVIELDDGSRITTVIKTSKDRYFRPGDRVRLVLDGRKIVNIERI
jgi:outer membrane lipoprotein SlyB